MAKKKRTTRRKRSTHRRRMAGLHAVRRKSTKSAKRKGGKRKGAARGGITQAGLMKPVNLVSMVLGAAAAWNYKDDVRLVKLIGNDKNGSGGMRYAAIAGLGLFGTKLLGSKMKLPEPVQYALLGAGVAGAIAAVPAFMPKLIPPPEMNGLPMGRHTQEQVAQLRAFIEKNRPMNGPGNGTLTGQRFGTMTGRRFGTMTGRKPVNVLTGMPKDNSYDMAFQ